jgi:intracellular septation protein A
MPRPLLLGLAAAAAFIVVASVLLAAMAKPLRPVDYLMIGAMATLAALVVLFIGVMMTLKQSDIFFKRRPKN